MIPDRAPDHMPPAELDNLPPKWLAVVLILGTSFWGAMIAIALFGA